MKTTIERRETVNGAISAGLLWQDEAVQRPSTGHFDAPRPLALGDLVTRGMQRYRELSHELAGTEGRTVAIEVESGDFFFGATAIEAYQSARRTHPGARFFFRTVGGEAELLWGGTG